jgi:hypothetical protein
VIEFYGVKDAGGNMQLLLDTKYTLFESKPVQILMEYPITERGMKREGVLKYMKQCGYIIGDTIHYEMGGIIFGRMNQIASFDRGYIGTLGELMEQHEYDAVKAAEGTE